MTNLVLCGPEEAARLLPMIAAAHEEAGVKSSDAARAEALTPLLEGSPHGVAYLIGPARAPIGYAVIGFGWSVAAGGLAGNLEELWIRPGVRGRGIGSEVLGTLPKALAAGGLRALTAAVPAGDEALGRFFRRSRFLAKSETRVLTLRL